MVVTDPSIIDFFICRLTLQMGYIDKPVDWLQYALNIRADTNFLIKLWWFENWECAPRKSVTVIGFGKNRIPLGFLNEIKSL